LPYSILCLLLLAAGSDSANFILKQSDASRFPSDNSKIEIMLETYTDGKLDSKERLDVYNKGANKSLIKFLESKRKGHLVLSVDENLWVYFPSARRPIRITPIQRILGQASTGDIARLRYDTDYNPTILREEILNDRACFVLELTAKSKYSAYRKIIYWVSKSDFLPRKGDYFLISGKHFKTAYFEDYQQFGRKKLVGGIRYRSSHKPREETLIRFLSYTEKSIPEKIFHKNYLNRVRL